jgi:hypothetical protein
MAKKKHFLDSYMAAMLDGEGAISLRQQNGYYQCRVSVSNTDKKLLEYIRDDWGGLEVRPMSNKNPNARISYQWIINGYHAIPLLQAVKPFCFVKKRHVEIALEYLLTCSRVRTPEALQRSAELALEMKGINLKGPGNAKNE